MPGCSTPRCWLFYSMSRPDRLRAAIVPSHSAAPPPEPTRRWTLWIDGCGGFRLLTGSRWEVGGGSADAACDIAVQTDWPRRAGAIQRAEGEYFWQVDGDEWHWLRHDASLPIVGSAHLVIRRPTVLSHSATLTLESSHRFAGHIDGVVLVQETVLVGPGSDCHIRCRSLPERVVLLHRDDGWRIKLGQQDPQPLQPARRFEADIVSLTIEDD